ncbi:tRNA pseudouridine(38-40) synthase TruA [Flavobacteriales bacterium]|nr:tRNA pseudouridine(38-40) synthase TruA [Flavobacteriales bacterium]
MRFFIEFSYKGTNYHGWQVQTNTNTVQAEINKALSTLLNSKIEVMGAGRTDAGVHAKQMYAHFDYNTLFDVPKMIMKLNSFLPNDIAIHAIFQVDDEVSSRFDAISRTYEYHIVQHKSPFASYAYYLHKKLDVDAMNLACKHLLGKQDFSSFSKANTQTFTNNCNVIFAKWEWENDELIFSIKADRFLRNMVRAIVGTLLEVGLGKVEVDDVKEIIKAKDRGEAGTSVPGNALFLIKVEYPKETIK